LNFPEKAKSIQICAYNQSHHIPAEVMEEHLKSCYDFQVWTLLQDARKKKEIENCIF